MLVFVKLGGSLITDKNQPRAVKSGIISRLMDEIHHALEDQPDLRLILGHGSGSFGHVAAQKYHTRAGVRTVEEWRGFIEVWREARDLNNIILEAMRSAGLPGIAFPPSAVLQADAGQLSSLYAEPLKAALDAGLIPLVNGDVIFDRSLGGTIFSTEEVFAALTAELIPDRILLCGLEQGVFRDYPECNHLLEWIDTTRAGEVLTSLSGSAGIDVTGGMVEKVRLMIDLIKVHPKLQTLIFSGSQADTLYRALHGENPGTLLCSNIHLLDYKEA